MAVLTGACQCVKTHRTVRTLKLCSFCSKYLLSDLIKLILKINKPTNNFAFREGNWVAGGEAWDTTLYPFLPVCFGFCHGFYGVILFENI